MIKIAYLDPYAVPDTRVASLQILQNADAFARQAAHVSLVTPESPISADDLLGRALHPGVTLHGLKSVRKKWYFPFNSQKFFFRQAHAWLKKNPVDAVFTRNLKLADFLLRHIPDTPLFFETHELFAQSFSESHDLRRSQNRRKRLILQKREQFIYRHATGIFALTSLLADDIASTYGTSRPIVIAADGVDLLAADKAYKQSPWQLHTPAKILYLGSLHPWKGVPTVIEAMQYVKPASLVIAGGDEKQITALLNFAAQLGVSDRVEFLGYVPPKSRFELIDKCDICVLPLTKTSIGSRYTSPLKLFEYMAMKKPVVISDLPSIRDVVDEHCVYFAQSESAESFSQGLLAVLRNPQQAALIAENARQKSLVYTWDNRAKIILDVIAARLR